MQRDSGITGMWRVYASAALATCLLAVLTGLAAASSEGLPSTGPEWPASINAPDGFQQLGRAISLEHDFPRSGSNVQRARYVASRLPLVAERYGLTPGSGSRLDNAFIFISRVMAGNLYQDPENTAMLNGLYGKGNCAEWSYAFCEMLSGAEVKYPQVAFGDSSPETGASLAFTGTDTMVVLNEYSPSGRYSRRVFDAFRCAYHGPAKIPTDETVGEWMDLPLDSCDRWKNEPAADTWLSVVKKDYVKDATTQALMEAPTAERLKPGLEDRPAGPADNKHKRWELKDTKVYPGSPFDSGPTWNRGIIPGENGFSVVDFASDPESGKVLWNWIADVSFDPPPVVFEEGKNFSLTCNVVVNIGPYTPGTVWLVWGSYEGEGIAVSNPDSSHAGVNVMGEEVPFNKCVAEFFPSEGTSDTVIIRQNSHKGHVCEFTYKLMP